MIYLFICTSSLFLFIFSIAFHYRIFFSSLRIELQYLTIICSLRRVIELFTNFSLAYRQESYFAYLFGVEEPGFYGAIVRYDINKSWSFFFFEDSWIVLKCLIPYWRSSLWSGNWDCLYSIVCFGWCDGVTHILPLQSD